MADPELTRAAVAARMAVEREMRGRRTGGRARIRARRDANHAAIVRALEAAGASVLDVSNIGGALDLVIGVAGVDVRVEVKDGDKPPSRRILTPDERETIDSWRGRRPVVIYSETEAVELVNRLRKAPESPQERRSAPRRGGIGPRGDTGASAADSRPGHAEDDWR